MEGALDPSLRHFHFEIEPVVLVASTVAALGGIAAAAAIYYAQMPSSSMIRSRLGPLPRVVERLYFVNEIAETGMVRGVLQGAGRGAALIDKYLVDGAVNMAGYATRFAGDMLRRGQTGQVQANTSLMLVGVVAAASTLMALSGGLIERVSPGLLDRLMP